jgi:phosphoribosylglycinamide formyltransferase-1
MKFVFLISTGGSVFKSLFAEKKMLDHVESVVSDRQCEAIDYAKENGVDTEILNSRGGRDFSNQLKTKFEGRNNVIFVSFYTRLFSGEFLKYFKGKVINFHPSILPACPGRDGFGDTLKSGSQFIGATVHFVDEGMDTGAPIIQSAVPFNPNLSLAENRHAVYFQQCKMLKQVIVWFLEDRVVVKGGRVFVSGASYDKCEFSPNLDIIFES